MEDDEMAKDTSPSSVAKGRTGDPFLDANKLNANGSLISDNVGPEPSRYEDFVTCITKDIPYSIQETTGKTDLPFPPDLASSITEEGLDFLQKTFGIRQESRYERWKRIYRDINHDFISAEESADAEKAISPRVIGGYIGSLADKSIPPAPLFFALAQLYLVNREKPKELDKIRSLRQEARDHADMLQRAISPLQKSVQTASKPGFALKQVAAWLEEHEFLDQLNELVTLVENDKRLCLQLIQTHKMLNRQLPESMKKSDTSDAIYRVFEAVTDFIGSNWGTRGAQGLARDLFRLWGIPVTDVNVRQARKRRKIP